MKQYSYSLKRSLAAASMLLGVTIAAQGQTMNIVVGNVTYAVPAAQAGQMVYTDGTTLTVLGKTFPISDISNIYIDKSTVSDGTVDVVYNGSSASVVVAGNIMQYLTATVSGANVTLVQSDDLAEEITYNLSGSSTNGSFYMDGSYKATVAMTDLQLTSTDSAAVNIENGKRINMKLSGTNTLSDAATSKGKAALMINGHSEFAGDGTLTVAGYAKHAIWTDEYLMTKKSFTGQIIVSYAKKDGMNINQYLEHRAGTISVSGTLDDGIQVAATDDAEDENNGQIIIGGGTLSVDVTAEDVKAVKCDSALTISDKYSTPTINITCGSASHASKGMKSGGDMTISAGTITISTAGYGVWDSKDSATSACAALKADGNMTISGGTLTLTATGAGGKGINCDGALSITGGTISINTSGNVYYNNGTTENTDYTASTDRITNSDYKSSPKGIKTDGAITISGGELTVVTTGNGGEGIESKSTLDISGGTVMSTSAKDDAINASSHLTISGGYVYAISAGNDGLDANGNMYIRGGVVYAAGTRSPEVAIDANTEGGYKLYITGGTVIAFGGIERGSSVSTAMVSTTATANTTYALVNGSNVVAAWKSPTSSYNYSSMAVYSSQLTSGTSYSLYKSPTLSGTSYFDGHYYAEATYSGSSFSTLTATSYSSDGGNTRPGGGGGRR